MNRLIKVFFISLLFIIYTYSVNADPCNPKGTKFPSSGNVTIASGDTYVISKKQNGNSYGTITVNGTLLFDNDDIDITVNNIIVNGTMQIGDPTCPINGGNTVKITFKGSAVGNGLGIMLNSGGTLVMAGERGVEGSGKKSWTVLSEPAGDPNSFGSDNGVAAPVTAADAMALSLADQVDWKVGDWIVVATSDFVSHHSEFVQIKSIDATGKKVILDSTTPLKFYHFGGLAPSADSFNDDYTTNYGVDERSEVGLITRNIRLTTEISSKADSIHFGGNIMIMNGYSKAVIQGVEIEKFGQPVEGKYPIHFHMAGNTPTAANTIINSNSIHHTFNKCLTIHSTNGLNIENNVCARNIGHSFFLETGSEIDNSFESNLVMGAMASSFVIPADSANVSIKFWEGDNMANQSGYNYDGMDVPVPETVPGLIANESQTPTGFWITNPDNSFTNNSVAGVQGLGRGFWILPVANSNGTNKLSMPIFKGNRAHACHNGIDNATDNGVAGFSNWTPIDDNGAATVILIEDAISTRNRNRGIWLRPSWTHVHNARMAMNRQSLSLVSSGGVEGSPPGVWELATKNVFVGISMNNVDRWGPCMAAGNSDCLGNTFAGKGFIDPSWNMFGYMFYDGPARLDSCKFINFNVDVSKYLTAKDRTLLSFYKDQKLITSGQNGIPAATNTVPYEGDAAMGWFQSNVNAYPPSQYVNSLIFENCDLKHQVYTAHVNQAVFADGDKNTVILDLDGSLSNFVVVDTTDLTKIPDLRYPVSLNNLPFLGTPYTVDECHSIGAQDSMATGRESSLMSPHDYATLESTIWYESNPNALSTINNNVIEFTKDMQDYGEFQSMSLVGRNFQGVYEPKLMDQLGYTIAPKVKALPDYISLGFIDVRKPDVSPTNPFLVRVGICYKSIDSSGDTVIPSKNDFIVNMGRKSYGQINGNAAIYQDSSAWVERSTCLNLTNKNPNNKIDCPADSASRVTIDAAATWSAFNANPGDTYFYDETKGMLFLYVKQDEPNAQKQSPLSDGTGQSYSKYPAPNGFDFYSCPEEGCFLYTIRTTHNYSSNKPLDCNCYEGASVDGDTSLSGYEQKYPKFKNQLAYYDAVGGSYQTVSIDQVPSNTGNAISGNFPYNKITSGTAPTDFCPTFDTNVPTNFNPAAKDGNIGLTIPGALNVKFREKGTTTWFRLTTQFIAYINVSKKYEINSGSTIYDLSFGGTNSSDFTVNFTGTNPIIAAKVSGGVLIKGL